jgi:hypothetical protein
VIERRLAELAGDLQAVGVTGRAKLRVLAEARDHLEQSAEHRGEAQAIRAFGDTRELASLVAADVAATATRGAAAAAFAVLALAGAAYAALFLTLPLAGPPDAFGGSVPGVGVAALLGLVVAPQVAFVSGCLALLRVVRTRRRGALPAAELRLQRWRTGTALAAGLLTVASLAAIALDFGRELSGQWVASALGSSIVLGIALFVVGGATVRSARPLSLVGGGAESVFDDIAPLLRSTPARWLDLPSHPWRFALLVGVGAAVAVALAGVAGGDPFDGLVRGAAELLCVLACFGALGRPLGLRR